MSDKVVRLTCDMDDAEFVAWVRDKCRNSIANTATGAYLEGVANRLLERGQEIERLRVEIERLRETLQDIADADQGASSAVAREALGDE